MLLDQTKYRILQLARSTPPKRILQILGKVSDPEAARQADVPIAVIKYWRHQRAIPSFRPRNKSLVHWTPFMVRKLGKGTDKEVAEKLKLRVHLVTRERYRRGIASPKAHPSFIWSEDAIAQLGTQPDPDIARIIGASPKQVFYQRDKLKIAPFSLKKFQWTKRRIAMLGTRSDTALAKTWKISQSTVSETRHSRNIERFLMHKGTWTPRRISLLGSRSDGKLAALWGISQSEVFRKRRKLGIPRFRRRTC